MGGVASYQVGNDIAEDSNRSLTLSCLNYEAYILTIKYIAIDVYMIKN